MALPRVTPGTYNYGQYANPTPVKYKGGIGEGIAGLAVAGAQIYKGIKEQKKAEKKQKEQNQFVALQSSHEYKKGLTSALPNANEDNIKLINQLTEEYYQNVLAYKNQSIDFDTFRLRDSKYQGIVQKLTNFKDYVLDKAEGEEPDFSLIRQTEGDITKWGRDKAFSYGAQGFKLIIGDDGSVGFQHAAIDFDKFKDENGAIDFSLIDASKSDSYKTINTDIDELFSDKNGFAPTIKYDYSQDAQFFQDTIGFLNKEAPRYAKGVDNGYAIFTEADKQRFKNEIVIPKIDDNIIKARGLQIYEDILGNVGQWNPDDPAQIAAVKNELANQLINKMPSTFGKLQQTGTGKGAGQKTLQYENLILEAVADPVSFYRTNVTKKGGKDKTEGAQYKTKGMGMEVDPAKFMVRYDDEVLDEDGNLIGYKPGKPEEYNLLNLEDFTQYIGTIVEKHPSFSGTSEEVRDAKIKILTPSYINNLYVNYKRNYYKK